MKKIAAFVLALCLPILASAEWLSKVDQRYRDQSPEKYAKVTQARALLAGVDGRMDRVERAFSILVPLVQQDPKFAPAYVQLARAWTDAGNLGGNNFDPRALAQAESALKQALTLEPQDDYAMCLMGFTMMFLGRLDEAANWYASAEKAGSTYPYLYTQLSELARKRKDLPTALRLAYRGYEVNAGDPPTAAGAITNILFVLQDMPGDTNAEEEKWHAKRSELAPDSPWFWQAWGSFRLYRFADWQKAIEYETKALSIMDFGRARTDLAMAYYTKWASLKQVPGRAPEATEAFQKAMKLRRLDNELVAQFHGSALAPIGAVLRQRLAAGL